MNQRTVMQSLAELENSPEIDGYLVGITSDLEARRSSYRREGFKDLNVIVDGLSAKEVLNLEEAVWGAIAANPQAHAKADARVRVQGNWRRALGGLRQPKDSYLLYVAWF